MLSHKILNNYLPDKTIVELSKIVTLNKANKDALARLLNDVFEPRDNFFNVPIKKQAPMLLNIIEAQLLSLVDEEAHNKDHVDEFLFNSVCSSLFEVLFYKVSKGIKLDAHGIYRVISLFAELYKTETKTDKELENRQELA